MTKTKNPKNYIWIAIVIIAFIGIVWIARPASPRPTVISPTVSGPNGTFVASENQYDFGAISMAGGKVTRIFTVENRGDNPLTITKLYTSCMCTTAILKAAGRVKGPFGMAGHGFTPRINETLSPDEEATVEVIFDPAAHGPAGVGRTERVVYLENNAGPALELKISATVTP